MAADPGKELHVNFLVIGAGPTGLGASIRLHQVFMRLFASSEFKHDQKSWLLVDELPGPGGLARSEMTPEGFLFDMGGHVTYSNYKFFDNLLDRAMGSGSDVWSTIERKSYIWIKDR